MEIWVSIIYLRKETKVKITEKRRPIVNACTKAGCNPRSHGLRVTQVWISTHWSKQVKVEISEIASSCNGGQGRYDTSPVGLENLRMPLLFHGTRYSATRRLGDSATPATRATRATRRGNKKKSVPRSH